MALFQRKRTADPPPPPPPAPPTEIEAATASLTALGCESVRVDCFGGLYRIVATKDGVPQSACAPVMADALAVITGALA